jgi:integrase
VELLCEYLRSVHINVFSATYCDDYVFRRFIPHVTKKCCLSPINVPMTYSRVHEGVKAKAGQIGLEPALFGTHSMRAGGATRAANSGVNDRMVQRHGRWASSSSSNRYILDDDDARLQVSKVLGTI